MGWLRYLGQLYLSRVSQIAPVHRQFADETRYVATEMTTSHTDERSKAYARKWQDMTPFDR
jgi:hypothetical protein